SPPLKPNAWYKLFLQLVSPAIGFTFAEFQVPCTCDPYIELLYTDSVPRLDDGRPLVNGHRQYLAKLYVDFQQNSKCGTSFTSHRVLTTEAPPSVAFAVP